ncbi:Mediator of RNA polymerase II transcription subunit 6 [Malassezia obtusa]|uniref:Mediator of RNA polymerase II transcription subunit 6 n=1 Tax=Malassezia obtusa TaxID=76774 RepID=A0AAF0E2Q9_9BASI|nr:Mediator of RNA polymerase II transcription subunit 6 [Malassezia obtusa]
MAAPEAPPFNPLHVQWKNPEMLAFLGAQKGGVTVGSSVLDASNVMEYFSTSPFYDRHSNNEHVRMQSAVLIAQTMAAAPQSGPELMANIARRHQEELKYVRGSHRLLIVQSSLLGLKTTLDLQREHRAAFSPRRGHFGRFLTADQEPKQSKMDEAP